MLPRTRLRTLPNSAGPLAGHHASGYNFQVPQVSPTFRAKVLFFGRVRELAGHREEAQELPEGATIADLFERYTRRFPDLAGFRASLVASRNQEFAASETKHAHRDEVAFLPPVSGG